MRFRTEIFRRVDAIMTTGYSPALDRLVEDLRRGWAAASADACVASGATCCRAFLHSPPSMANVMADQPKATPIPSKTAPYTALWCGGTVQA